MNRKVLFVALLVPILMLALTVPSLGEQEGPAVAEESGPQEAPPASAGAGLDSAGEWTWMSGSSALGQPGVYGELGVPDAANVPGGREYSVSWTDTSGNLWLLGGMEMGGIRNDLWRYETPPTPDSDIEVTLTESADPVSAASLRSDEWTAWSEHVDKFIGPRTGVAVACLNKEEFR